VLIYTMQAVSQSKRTLGRHRVQPSRLSIQVKTRQDPTRIAQVRVVPKQGFVVVEIFMKQMLTPLPLTLSCSQASILG